MNAIRSLQPKASTRPASSARQPARSSIVTEWSCCWSRHHCMREMILVSSYFIAPSCAWCFALYYGIRDWGNVLSCESPHLRTGKTRKERGNRPECSFRYPGVATLFEALTRKGLNPRHWQVNGSVVQKQLFFTLETRSLPLGSAHRLVLPRLLLDRSRLVVG